MGGEPCRRDRCEATGDRVSTAAKFLPGPGRGTSEAGGGAATGAGAAGLPLHHQPSAGGPPPRAGEELNPRGKLTSHAPLAPLVWFKSGGAADWLFEPKDADDLSAFLADLDPAVPVMALGLGSNMIVRDGGVGGVVIRPRQAVRDG